MTATTPQDGDALYGRDHHWQALNGAGLHPAPADPHDDDPAYVAHLAELEAQCRVEYVTRTPTPYSTSCDLNLPAGHEGQHRGPDPLGGDGTVHWTGGGSAGGDALPCTDVSFRPPATGEDTGELARRLEYTRQYRLEQWLAGLGVQAR